MRDTDAESECYLYFRQCFRELTQVLCDKEILLHELFEILLSFILPKKRPNRQARAGDARVAQTDLASPLRIEKIIQ